MQEAYINSVNIYSNTNFPYLVLDVEGDRVFPRNPGFRVMHWHEDLQLIYVIEGRVAVRTLEDEVLLSSGEGMFINKNVVHLVDKSGVCHYNSFLFPECFLSYYPGSPVEELTQRVTEDKGTPYIILRGDVTWERRVLDMLKELRALEDCKGQELYFPQVLLRLNELWLVLIENYSRGNEMRDNPVIKRTRLLLDYIQKHYAEDITLEDLARCAFISKSEALRCFKETLNTTPYRYLMDYRLSKAAELLADTDLPVGTVSELTGFHQQSYFGKCFHESMGCTPGAWRRAVNGRREGAG